MHSFIQTARKNNHILAKFCRQLRTSGNDFGYVQVQINDIMRSTDPEILMYINKFRTNRNTYTGKFLK